MYEEEDDDLPAQYRRLTAHLATGNLGFDRRLSAYLTGQYAARSALDQAIAQSFFRQMPLPYAAPQLPYQPPAQLPAQQQQQQQINPCAQPACVPVAPEAGQPDGSSQSYPIMQPYSPYPNPYSSLLNLSPFSTALPTESQLLLGPSVNPNPFTSTLMAGNDNAQNPFYSYDPSSALNGSISKSRVHSVVKVEQDVKRKQPAPAPAAQLHALDFHQQASLQPHVGGQAEARARVQSIAQEVLPAQVRAPTLAQTQTQAPVPVLAQRLPELAVHSADGLAEQAVTGLSQTLAPNMLETYSANSLIGGIAPKNGLDDGADRYGLGSETIDFRQELDSSVWTDKWIDDSVEMAKFDAFAGGASADAALFTPGSETEMWSSYINSGLWDEALT